MASRTRLSALFQAIRRRDWSKVDAAALEICNDEAKKGHHAAARLLRSTLAPNSNASEPQQVPESVLAPENALSPIDTEIPLSAIRLPTAARKAIAQFTNEWVRRGEFAKSGLPVRTKLLLHGPPGCGKSVTAAAIARDVGLPAYVVRFDSIIASYLGQTAVRLRQLFQFAEATPTLLLIDEIDALARRRGHPSDVGELDRVVVALLQELEHSRPSGIIVATSNLASNLDAAIWRRFDLVVNLPQPRPRDLLVFAKQVASTWELPMSPSLKRQVAAAKNFATVRQLVEGRVRERLLNEPAENS